MHINNDSINYFFKPFWKLWTCTILCRCIANFDVILPNFMFYEDVNTRKWEKVKNSSPKKLLANCRSTVGRQLADCHLLPFAKNFCQQSADRWLFVGQLSADCWQHVGNVSAIKVSVENACWIPEKSLLALEQHKMELFHLNNNKYLILLFLYLDTVL